ncbi:hypothetical protein [Olivibacter domesticus]|uniref:Uncharacterized protein n=1 Tax=Olivibacter domesticus TaxID=407022 RepID=A0A1H7KG02_OLID1|nr:hypothetical protein [Olivibacter domesticus]SEK85436.1 hypothetical protein SAMN05661044_01330 [Olivibacter domesticus]
MTHSNLKQAKEEVRALCRNRFDDQQPISITESEEYLRLRWERDDIHYSMDFLYADLAKWQDAGDVKEEVEKRINFANSNKKLPENNPNAPEAFSI